MEASAFYETAIKFSTAELIYTFKVISDNHASPAQNIQPKQVARWIADHVDSILEVQEQLQQLAQEIKSHEPPFYQVYSDRWHFTVSQKQRLEELLSRWEVVSNGKDPGMNFQLANAKTVLSEMEQKISDIDYFL
jgi:septal ring factor EnvC (AmiA/AmiB activator)